MINNQEEHVGSFSGSYFGTHLIVCDSEVKKMTFCLASLCSSDALTIVSQNFLKIVRLARQKSLSV